LFAGGTVAYDGTLVVTNLGSAFAAGDSFKIFNASAYSGVFTNIVPATPGAGLAWNTSNLTVNGTLSVMSVTSGSGTFTNKPGITHFSISNGNIVISGTNGQNGDAYYLLESTNVASPLSLWVTVATNVLGADGNFTFTGTNVVTPGDRQQFYILSNTNWNH
jgi:hypothetical protein